MTSNATNIHMGIKHFDMLIGGDIVPSADKAYFECLNPSSGDVFATVTNAGLPDIEKAIRSAETCVQKGSWRKLPLLERGIYLKKLAKLIRDHFKELAELESMDTGKTSKQSTFIDVPTCADTFDYFSNIDKQLDPRVNLVEATVKSTTVFEPMGVVGAIIPWNYPLIMAAWKLAPALMAGNAVVLKPSPMASVSILRLAQIIQEVNFPKGIVNIVPSDRVEVARALVASDKVQMISFTGGTQTGKDILRQAGETPKKISLELGGKSANIVFADCDRQAAVGGTMSAIFMNQGQMCTAGSRLFVEETIYDEFLDTLVARTKKLVIGSAMSYETEFGPVISEFQRDRLQNFVQDAVAQGAKIECGGRIPTQENLQDGFYFEPTILSNVTNDMAVAQEEIFGPVLCAMKFSSIDEAIRQANDSKYGLAAMVWTQDPSKQTIACEELQCGTVWINTYGGFYNEASFGGYKQSGFGRELGVEGLLEYTQSKHVCIDQTPGGKPLVANWF